MSSAEEKFRAKFGALKAQKEKSLAAVRDAVPNYEPPKPKPKRKPQLQAQVEALEDALTLPPQGAVAHRNHEPNPYTLHQGRRTTQAFGCVSNFATTLSQMQCNAHIRIRSKQRIRSKDEQGAHVSFRKEANQPPTAIAPL